MTQVRGTLGKEGSSGLMSAEELKVRLQQHFAKSGTLNNLKTQLRNQLVTELFKVAELPTNKIENEFSDAEAKKTLLPLQVSNWLVYDHLKRQGYDYSLSTFATEASVSFPEKLLSLRDVLDLLGFKSDSEESETITEHYVHCKHGSFLHSLLLCVMKQHKKHNHNLFDLHCKENKFKDNTVLTADGNITMHEQLYHNGNWSEPQNKQPRSNLLDESQNRMEMHQQKLYQMLQSEKEGQQNEAQRLRQKLLSELDRLYEHEQQVRLELEQRKNRLTREQELLDIEKNKLRAKELELEKRASHIETENEKSYLIKEQHLSASLKKKEEEFAELEDRLKQQEHRLNEERQIFSIQKRELEDLRNQLQQSEKNYQHIQNEYSTLLAENAVLKEKVENATDYEHIKVELLKYLKETESCKMEIKEIKERSDAEKHVLLNTVKNLEEQLRICLQKANSVKDVGVSAVTSHFQDESMWNEQKSRLEQDLSETKQLYHNVLQKLQEQNEDIQDLHLAIHVLHDEISHPTNKGNHSLKAQDQNSRPVLPPTIPGPDNRPAQLQRTLSPHTTQPQYNAQYSGLFYPTPVVQRTPKENPYTFISEAKKRISDLEREAQAVREKYSVFIASQMKLPSPSYTAYGNDFHNYDFMGRTNQDYTIPSSKSTLLLSSLQTGVTGKRDNNHTVPFTHDSYFVTSYHNNNTKMLTHHGMTDPQDVEMARNSAIPHDRHAQFQNDQRFVSLKINSSEAIPSDSNNPVQKLNTYPGNTENNLLSHVQIRPGHSHPVCSDSTSMPVSSVSHDQFSTLLLDHGEQLLSTTNVASSSESPNTLRHASIDHPFHLSKFGLYSTSNKTLTSPPVIPHNQAQPNTTDSKSQMVNHTKQNDFCGESLSQGHPKASDTSTLNNKSSDFVSVSNANTQSFLEPELPNEQGKRHLCQEQVEAQVSNQQTEQLQNVSSEQVDSENSGLAQNFNVLTGCQEVLKPNKNIESSRDVKELSGQTSLSDIIPNFRKDTSAKMGATKPENNVTPRRLSVDLDSAWKQQTESTSLVVKNFMRPRSGSSHSLPSRFNLTGTAAAAELKPDMKPGVKYDDIIEKEVSSPRSHSFSETHMIANVEKIKPVSAGNSNDIVARTDGTAICQPSEDLRNPHESISSISNQVDMENVKDLENHEKHFSVNLGSICHTKESDSNEFAEKGGHISNDSHSYITHEGDNIQQSGNESDHDSSSNIKLLHHDDDEIIASPKRDILVPSELNADVAASDLLHDKKLDLDAKTGSPESEVDNHQDSIKSCENEAGSVKDPMKEEKSTVSDVSGGENDDNEGDLEASVSELSELNLSAGNEELERSKSEESGW